MIPTSAVDNYLGRSLDDHRWLKVLSAEEVDDLMASIRPRLRTSPRLRLHQRACFVLGVAYPKMCFFLDMGSGKTILSLELLRYWFSVGRIRRAIVFVTSDKAYPSWERQFREFDIDLPHVSLDGSSADKWQALREMDGGVVIVHYPGAVAMVTKLTKIKGKDKNKRILDDTKIAEMAEWADAIVMDESTRAGSHLSITFKMLDALRPHAKVRYALSGRPHGRDPTMLWPQFKLIDDGETLGGTLGLFRAAFFTEQKIHWDPTGRASEYKFIDNRKDDLSRMLQHRSITYSAEECVDLPKVVTEVVRVGLPEEAELYYKRLVDRVIGAKGNLREMKNVFTRMRQVSSGFVGFVDDETGERAEVEFADNPKLDALLELIDEVPEDRQFAVFYDFTRSGWRIADELKKRGIDCVWLWSGTKDARGDLERFTSGEVRGIVIQNRVGAYSLDGLQIANYLFVYESPVGCIDREQMERRLVRQGQEHRVFIYDLVVRGTMDERILLFHKEGGDLFAALLRDPSVVIGAVR